MARVLLILLAVAAIGVPVAFCHRKSSEARESAERAETAANIAARIAKEPWRAFDHWKGTEIAASQAIPEAVSIAFAADPPAPDGRKTTFREFLAPTAHYPVVGWAVMITSITPNDDGWEVSANVWARLKRATAHLFNQSVETWQVSKSGEARCVSSKPGQTSTATMLMVD
jgi:hypothetical protein